MTDYKKATGSSGLMMIRVNDPLVEFFINSQNDTTRTDSLPWGYTINGSTNNSKTIAYPANSGWVKLLAANVTTDQTVVFRIFDTNTSGFGGPTTFEVAINRASAPNAPSAVTISGITGNSMNVTFTDGANNGDAIDARQVAWNDANTTSGALVSSSDRSTTLTGLSQGTTYYVWARTHNSKGYSPWSPVRSAKTLAVPAAPDQPIVTNATQTSVVISFTDNGNGGSAINDRGVYYSTMNSVSTALFVPYAGVRTITGLSPGKTYFFWARVHNSVGWGAYSPVATLRTIAGARLNVNGVWKEAIPYVKVNGVWKLARPWGRVSGTWTEST